MNTTQIYQNIDRITYGAERVKFEVKQRRREAARARIRQMRADDGREPVARNGSRTKAVYCRSRTASMCEHVC